MVPRVRRVGIYVAAIACLSIAVMWSAYAQGKPTPDYGALVAFWALALFLERTATALRFKADGSVTFVVHLSSVLVFGAFWGGVLALTSTGVSEALYRRPLQKAVFNSFQKALSTAAAGTLYAGLGGRVPPASILHDLLPFYLIAVVYFSTNTLAVAGAIALSTGRSLREVWTINARGSLLFDVLASSLALLVVGLFKEFAIAGLLAVVIPTLVVRSLYEMYHRGQAQSRELLELMVKSMEARDPYTSGHSVRVATMSRAIAEEYHLSYRVVDQIYAAALLHDVGKIHEEFAPLLRKPDRLTPDEEALLQTHPVKSADLVGVISSFRGTVVNSVRSHHERWDGRGYPDSLAAEVIPLGARIIAVADTVDAMTTDRPYRAAATPERAIEELRRCRGTQFDPGIVDLAVGSVVVRALIAAPHGLMTSLPEGEPRPKTSERQGSGWRVVIG